MTARRPRPRFIDFAIALLALALVAVSLAQIEAAGRGIRTEAVSVDGTPARIFRPDGRPGPVVVIAHGFAGSQQLMQSFALALARNGYVAVTFDFAGHGRNPRPLGGDVTREDGATRTLVGEVAAVAAAARPLGDGRLAVLGHSMASDIVVRFARDHPEVAATIAVSMFSPAVTAASPGNLLVIVGDWEGPLKREGLRVVGQVSAPEAPQPGRTYGDPAAGSGRRVAIARHVEHVGVLFSRDSMEEALGWLDATFATTRSEPIRIDARGPWILCLLAGVVLLGWPLSRLLPVVASPPAGAALRWREGWILLVPMLATPLLLRVLPTRFLPVPVGDYLAAHFLAYGLLTGACLLALRGRHALAIGAGFRPKAFLAAVAAVSAYVAGALFWPIDGFVTSFVPGSERVVLVAAMLVGTLAYFLADEWLTRGVGSGRGIYAATKMALLVSLAIAVGLDFQRLFFLIIIVPVIVPFLVVHGLFSVWIFRRTGFPLVAGVANAAAFAWAIGVTFPILAG